MTYIVDPGNDNASIHLKRADGSTAPARLPASGRAVAEALWSGDNRWLVVRTTIPSRDIIGLRPGTDSAPVPLVATTRFDERAATLSPDGRFIAYQSDESGRDEIYVRPFPRTEDGRWQLSTAGGEEPLWSRGGREVFYRSPSGEIMTVPVTTTPSFSPGAPRALFATTDYAKTPGNRAYDVTPDDQRSSPGAVRIRGQLARGTQAQDEAAVAAVITPASRSPTDCRPRPAPRSRSSFPRSARTRTRIRASGRSSRLFPPSPP